MAIREISLKRVRTRVTSCSREDKSTPEELKSYNVAEGEEYSLYSEYSSNNDYKYTKSKVFITFEIPQQIIFNRHIIQKLLRLHQLSAKNARWYQIGVDINEIDSYANADYYSYKGTTNSFKSDSYNERIIQLEIGEELKQKYLTFIIYHYYRGNYEATFLSNESLTILYEENEIIPLNPVGTIHGKNESLTFEWIFNGVGSAKQKEFTLQTSMDSSFSSIINDIHLVSEDTKCSIPEYSFPTAGTVYWRLKIVDTEDTGSDWIITSFEVVKSKPLIKITFPVDINISSANAKEIIFTWDYSERYLSGQKSVNISGTDSEGATFDYSFETDNNYAIISRVFPVGAVNFKITVTNNDGMIDSQTGSFTVVGTTSAPDITLITNSCQPTVEWTSTNQECFEMELLRNNNVIYYSGLIISKDTSFELPIWIEDGSYSIRIRVLNVYGYYTDWTHKSFVISTTKPPKYPSTFNCNKDDLGIHEISYLVDELPLEDLEPEIHLIEMIDGAEKDLGAILPYRYYYRFKTPVNKNIKYKARFRYPSYTGFTDTDEQLENISISDNGFVIHNYENPSEFVTVSKSEEKNSTFKTSRNINKVFNNILGRRYPIKDHLDNEILTKTISCWVSDEDYVKLLAFENLSAVYLRERECFKADLSVEYVSKSIENGHNLTLTFTRLDESGDNNEFLN